MNDRDKLLRLWQDLKSIEYPKMSNDKLQVLVNTIECGIHLIKDWLVDQFKNG